MEPALIERFFNKQCTPAEAKKVALYLKANPFILEQYLSKDEWNKVAYNQNLSQEFWDELWQTINKKEKARVKYIRLKRFAAAASVIFIIAAIYFFQQPSKPVIVSLTKATVPLFEKKTISNTTQKTMHIVLPDSSVVALAPSSHISYTIPFQNNRREILLEGEAAFHVTKNKLKPFTVYAGALATTALGTVFSIKKNDAKNNIIIKLYKGKVVIQSTDKNLKGWYNDVYLLPGDQMNFNTAAALLTVKKNNDGANQNTFTKNKLKQPAVDSLKDELIFNNTKLTEVINKLSAFYSVKIQYDSVFADTMNFTGTVSKSDSLPVILNVIGEMNALEITKNEDGFIISKHK